MNDEELLVYFDILKMRQNVTLLCICGAAKCLSFQLKFIVFGHFRITNNSDRVFRPLFFHFRFHPVRKI
jgi:hypothetical protein